MLCDVRGEVIGSRPSSEIPSEIKKFSFTGQGKSLFILVVSAPQGRRPQPNKYHAACVFPVICR